MTEEAAASDTAFKILECAKESGADAIMVVCPLCHLMLDANQHAMEKKFGTEIDLPVLYVTQLTGLALGLGVEELGMGMNSVSPAPVLERLEVARGAEEEEGEVC